MNQLRHRVPTVAPTGITTVASDLLLAAHTNVSVLITGASRDQRSRCARFIHVSSNSGSPFVNLWIPRLGKDRTGGLPLSQRFDSARGGTLFIDDIADLTLDGQAALFFLLEDRAAQTSTLAAYRPGVRVITGANRHLDAERRTGAFSDRLFCRLNIIHLDLFVR